MAITNTKNSDDCKDINDVYRIKAGIMSRMNEFYQFRHAQLRNVNELEVYRLSQDVSD